MHFHRKLAVLFIIYAWGTTSHFPFSSSSSLHFESILFTDDDIHGYTYFHSPTSMRLFNEFVSFLINVNVPGDIISRLFYSRRSNGLCLVSNFNYGQQLSRASSRGYAKRAFGDLEGMRVNGEICLLFHFDEIENTRPLGEEKFKDGSHKIHLAYASLEEVFSRISIGLEKIHCALSSFFFLSFFLYFFRYYIDQWISQGCCCFAKETQASHRLSRRINGIGQFGELCFGRWVFVLGENSGKRKLNCPRRESRWSFRKRDYE